MSAGAGMIQVRIRHPQIMDHHRVILHPMTVHRHLQVQEASMPVGEILEAEDLAEIFNSPPRHNTSAGVNKQKNMKELKDFKDEVAQGAGYENWAHLFCVTGRMEQDVRHDEAAELYARYLVQQAKGEFGPYLHEAHAAQLLGGDDE